MEHLFYQIALTKIPKVGPVTARTLVSYCGSPQEVFLSSTKSLLKIPGIGGQLTQQIKSEEPLRAAEKELLHLEKQNIAALFYLDEHYPSRLKHYPDSPLIVYHKGSSNLNASRIVAIVGTRKPTVQGTTFCEEFLEQIAPYEPLIISGLAYGIDICAHRKALELKLPTVGVLAHGLAHLYPPTHRSVAQRMLENGGIITEYGFETNAEKEHFPLRNRIIAGMCDALLVVETARYGGSIITANFANEYNKDVFAVPGRVKDPFSAGCNELIKNNQAHLLESAEDLVRMLRWDLGAFRYGVQQQLFTELSVEEKNIVNLLRHDEEKDIDALTYLSQKSNSEMATLLLELEFKGVIRALPGKRYVLV
ncbi:DNA-processing protein DprA [Haliscomenobacter hydrossis]|uniref:DNA protecting protein DprA n=1 Tax=Haliscomenobacter hydrossis (strain ATCC 27775 / DSM 1100 / LMG 10767 / O) TaxID=760192 RepID=F4L5W3_HALH1|nr:DNA-processing protein DprA [Haliscomenobacter hydrossis]AEE52073.1 DNA protecting protein DprA [Haliscomenobacter hydrossis DSM 1100]